MSDGLYDNVPLGTKSKVKSYKVVDDSRLLDIEQLLYDICIYRQEMYKTNEITYSLLKDLSCQLNDLYAVGVDLLKVLRKGENIK